MIQHAPDYEYDFELCEVLSYTVPRNLQEASYNLDSVIWKVTPTFPLKENLVWLKAMLWIEFISIREVRREGISCPDL